MNGRNPDRDTERIKWHCRRGLLELDLVLERFVVHHLGELDAGQTAVFKELLAYEDNDLLDMVLGRADPVNERLSAVLEMMRAA
jgi:succinate dehydrogenase flavin-adding protein (antitoxin of CptAB toxin-antitoxin module)